MKRSILLVFAWVFIILNARSQSFYEVNWNASDGINYSAFISYYSDDNIFVRVGYVFNSKYVVASYACKASYQIAPNGKKYYIMDGFGAKIVYHQFAIPPLYLADNFVFTNLDENNKFDKIYISGDDFFNAGNYQLASIKSIDPKLFNDDFLLRFYIKDEPSYKLFSAYVKKPDEIIVNENGTMHLIIVANSLDHSIGASCERDRIVLENEFSGIAAALHMKTNTIMIYGTDFKKANVLEKVYGLNPNPNDIIIFFYRGHGYRLTNQSSDWPLMAMQYSSYQPLEGLAIDEIYNIIIKKRARLNLVFGDLCNTEVSFKQMVFTPTIGFQSNFYPNTEKLNKLFLKARGNLLSVAAKPGEGSYTHIIDGGYYTSSVINSIHNEVSIFSVEGTWETLIDKAINEAEYRTSHNCEGCIPQHGIRYIDIRYDK